MKTKIIRWLAVLSLGYVAIMVMLMLFETRLIYPAPRGGDSLAVDFGGEDIVFESADGTSLHGWFFSRDNAALTMVFFHGNGESVETSGPTLGRIAEKLNADLFIFDYRGYGKSHGKPFEQGVVEDGTAAVQWLKQRTGKPSQQIVFLGRSLGGGVAVQVARQETPCSMILVSTFSSITEVAQSAFRWVPVRFLMKNRFDSAKAISTTDIPLLQFHGDRDRIIPIELGKKLHAASPAADKRFVVVEDHGHNDLSLDSCLAEIRQFLKSPDR